MFKPARIIFISVLTPILATFFAFPFIRLWRTPARAETPAPKDFYVGLYGSTNAYDYFQNSLLNTVVYQTQYYNWKDRPYIPEFIYNFTHTNSIINDRPDARRSQWRRGGKYPGLCYFCGLLPERQSCGRF